MTARRLLVAVVLLGGLTAAMTFPRSAAAGGGIRGFSGAPQGVTTASLGPHLVSDEHFYEQYNFEAQLDGGVDFYLRLRIANLGPGDGRMEVTVRTRDPRNRKRLKYSAKLDRDGWTHAKGRFLINAGQIEVEGTPAQITVRRTAGDFQFELVFARQAKGWRPGDGRVRVGDDGYYSTEIIFPRARVKGFVAPGGTRLPVQGWGYALHSFSNVAPPDLARRWVQFDSHDSEYAVYLRHFVPAKGLGQKPVSFLLVTYKDQVVFQSYRVRIKAEKVSRDGKTKARYVKPARIVVQAEARGQTVQAVLEGTKLYHRSAMLEEAGTVERMVIARFAEPVDYNYRCDYTIRITNAGHPPVEFKGKATYSVNYLNP